MTDIQWTDASQIGFGRYAALEGPYSCVAEGDSWALLKDHCSFVVRRVLAATPHITYQVLTKRAERLPEWFEWFGKDFCTTDYGHPIAPHDVFASALDSEMDDGSESDHDRIFWSKWSALHGTQWPLPNVHLGVSVEDQQRADERIPLLLDPRVKAAVKWVSAEPLLGPVDFSTTAWTQSGFARTNPLMRWALDWVVVGGESGPGARACDVRWIRSLVEQCRAASVPCFVKQLGAKPVEWLSAAAQLGDRGSLMRVVLADRAGGDPSEWPEDLRVREWPR